MGKSKLIKPGLETVRGTFFTLANVREVREIKPRNNGRGHLVRKDLIRQPCRPAVFGSLPNSGAGPLPHCCDAIRLLVEN